MACDPAVERLRRNQEPWRSHVTKGIVRSARTSARNRLAAPQEGDVTFNDLLRVFWQRKLRIILITLAIIIPAYAATEIVPAQYESTSTLALTPKESGNDLVLFGILDTVVPFYADAATSRTTLNSARELLGRDLEDVSVQTFKGTGIVKIKSRSTNPRRAQQSAAAVTDALLKRVSSGDVGIPSLKLGEIDAPAVSSSPVFPRVKLTLIVAGLLGLGLGLGVALLSESLTTKIESADDLAETSGVPVFAEIPAETAILKMHDPVDLGTHPRLHIVAEALRDLRTNLLFTDDSIRSIVVTSPDGSHGKTTVAFGLAATLARAGTRTLLVDGDLRRGRVAELLDLPRAPGLIEVLRGEAELADAIHSTAEGLDVLAGGRRSANPGEVLTSEFPTLLSHLERDYEAVIIDCTPVVPISDARIVARYADATLLVVRAGSALRRQVRAAVDRLELISVKPTAAVLNHSVTVRGSSYYVRPSSEAEAAGRSAKRLSQKRGAAGR
jgi:tyrosine-protein kinase